MSTSRKHTATTTGPIELVTSGPNVDFKVIAEPGRTTTEIEVTTDANEGPAAETVNAAQFRESGNRVTVTIPKSAGTTTVMNTGRGVSVVGGVIDGDVIVTGGSVIVNGVRISSGGGRGIQVNNFSGGSHITIGGSKVLVIARVPEGSSADLDSTNGDVDTTGILNRVRGKSQNGDVHVDYAADVDANTMNGSISISRLAGRANLHTMNGGIRAHAVANSRLTANSMNGGIETTKGGGVEFDVDARSMNGRVRNR